MIRGTPEIRSDKSLTLLTFDICHLTFDIWHLNIQTFEHANIGTLENWNVETLEHLNIWTLKLFFFFFFWLAFHKKHLINFWYLTGKGLHFFLMFNIPCQMVQKQLVPKNCRKRNKKCNFWQTPTHPKLFVFSFFLVSFLNLSLTLDL